MRMPKNKREYRGDKENNYDKCIPRSVNVDTSKGNKRVIKDLKNEARCQCEAESCGFWLACSTYTGRKIINKHS